MAKAINDRTGVATETSQTLRPYLKVIHNDGDAEIHAHEAISSLRAHALDLFDEGHLDEALVILNRALMLDPDQDLVHITRANILNSLGRFDEAILACDLALALGLDVALVHVCRCYALREADRLEEALSAGERAVNLEPGLMLAYGARGNALNALGRFDEAIADGNYAIKLDPSYATGHAIRGFASRALGHFGKAVADFRIATKLSPTNDRYKIELENTEKLLSDEQKDDLVSGYSGYNDPTEENNNGIYSRSTAPDVEKEFEPMPVNTGPAKQEILQLAAALELVAARKGLSSVAELDQAIDYWKAAKAEHTERETTGRVAVEPHLPAPLPQSHKEKLAAAKKLLTGELPPLFARKRARRKPGKPSLQAEARRITSQYERDNGKVIYDEYAMSFVQAGWVIVNANKPKSQTVKKSKATPARAIRRPKSTL